MCFVKTGTGDLLHHLYYKYRLKSLPTPGRTDKVLHAMLDLCLKL